MTSDAVYGGTLVHSWSIQTTAAPTAAGETAGIWQEVHTVAAVVVALLAPVLCFQGDGIAAWCWLHVKGSSSTNQQQQQLSRCTWGSSRTNTKQGMLATGASPGLFCQQTASPGKSWVPGRSMSAVNGSEQQLRMITQHYSSSAHSNSSGA